MKLFSIKHLIKFRKTQNEIHVKLALLVAAIIITGLLRKTTVSRYFLFLFVCHVIYILAVSNACTMHRKKHQRFKVYLSFSEVRIPEMVKFIDAYLKPAFWLFNIEYYDFREHKQFHHLDIYHICNEIDKNLADSDIFVRFIDIGFEPHQFRLANSRKAHGVFNPFTLSYTGIPDYARYEIDISYDKFGFIKPNNRFQVSQIGVDVSPRPHIKPLFIDVYGSPLDDALKLINELNRGYQDQQFWLRVRALD